MQDKHEPHEDFVAKLEWHVKREVRQRNRIAQAPVWVNWSRARMLTAVGCLMLASMAAGGAVVAAAYEAQSNERRNQLSSNFEERLRLAETRLGALKNDLQLIQQRVSVGVASNMELLESRNKVAEAEGQLQRVQLDLEEVRITGNEPRHELSAPRAGGRDFVSQRLKIDMMVAERALALERTRLQDTKNRVELGVVDAAALEISQGRVVELEAALRTFQQKLAARDTFLGGRADATITELRALEADAEQKQRTLVPKLDLARKDAERVKARVATGIAQQTDLTLATVQQLTLELALREAELDLQLIRRRIDQHRAGK
jgi:hypothetical protein